MPFSYETIHAEISRHNVAFMLGERATFFDNRQSQASGGSEGCYVQPREIREKSLVLACHFLQFLFEGLHAHVGKANQLQADVSTPAADPSKFVFESEHPAFASGIGFLAAEDAPSLRVRTAPCAGNALIHLYAARCNRAIFLRGKQAVSEGAPSSLETTFAYLNADKPWFSSHEIASLSQYISQQLKFVAVPVRCDENGAPSLHVEGFVRQVQQKLESMHTNGSRVTTGAGQAGVALNLLGHALQEEVGGGDWFVSGNSYQLKAGRVHEAKQDLVGVNLTLFPRKDGAAMILNHAADHPQNPDAIAGLVAKFDGRTGETLDHAARSLARHANARLARLAR